MPELAEANLPGLGDCREMFADTDAAIDAAGVRHAAYHQVPGFPYLRTDRMLATYAEEVESIDALGTWVRRMRELDYEARFYELRNLGIDAQTRANLHTDLFRCGRGLAFVDLENPDNLELLRNSVMPADARLALFGQLALPDLTAPLLKVYNGHRNEALLDVFTASRSDDATSTGRYLEVEETQQRALAPDRFDGGLVDPLGFPGLISSAWTALAEQHAPALWLHEAASSTPGRIVLGEDGPQVDTRTPTVYHQAGFTRLNGKPKVQLTYVLFFGEGDEDVASLVDSQVWRVTLDDSNQPLLYDTVSAGGWPHALLPLAALQPRAKSAVASRPVVIAVDGLDAEPVLRIDGQPPRIRQAMNQQQANPSQRRQYELRAYDELFILPFEGGTRSLFADDGTVAGAPAAGIWTRLAGIPGRGRIRQLGRMPGLLSERGSFDDPYMLQHVFRTQTTQAAR